MRSLGAQTKLLKRLIPVAVLYGGRVGIAALGLIILPWLSKVMPAEEFGLAATVISLQSLSIVLDLGLSITITRELPAVSSANERRSILSRCERILVILYCVITAIAIGLSTLGFLPVPVPTVILICLSMFLVVWQNIIVVAFIARQRFITSTITQFASLLLRLGIALAFVAIFTSSLQVFVLGQFVGSMVVFVTSRVVFNLQNRPDDLPAPKIPASFGSNFAVMLYTIAGACALQLDKVLLSGLASPVFTGPYFLASILSLVPITFLASPLAQFVQPKLIASLVLDREEEASRWIARLTIAILALAVLPGIILTLSAPYIVPFWLQGSVHQADVIRYVMLLMPGASIGALGLIPAIILIARRDYRALATMSCVLTATVLTTTAVLANENSIESICIAYAIYHVIAAAALWWRAWRIEPCFTNSFGFLQRDAKGRT